MNRTILLVDDDAATRHAVREFLEEEGFSVCVACDGQEAVDLLVRLSPDLVLSDLHMPRMNGEELILHLQAHAPKLPVIVITAHTAVDARRQAQRLGAADFINKPLDFSDVLDRIRRVLG